MGNTQKVIFILQFIICLSFVSAGFGYNNIDDLDLSTTIYQGNLTNFTQLQDTPITLIGQTGLCVAVNAAEDSLEFIACGAAGGLDGNASSICALGEYLDGGGDCIDLNATIDDRALAASDTNETNRFTNLTLTDCPAGNYTYGVDVNGSIVCRDDLQSTSTDTNCSDGSCLPVFYWSNQSYLNETTLALSINTTTNIQSLLSSIITWVMNFSKIYSDDWSNVTITTSQITDYVSVDTNASTCAVGEYLDGDGTCININNTIVLLDTNISNWTKADLNTLFNDTQWFNKTYTDSLYAGSIDTNCSDGSCLPVLYWANDTFWNVTYNETYEHYAFNVSLNYTQIVFDTYNSIWSAGTDTNCSDGSCLPVFYWANQSYLNETDLALSINTTTNINLLETEWDSNFTNIQTKCPGGNYSYGVYINGTTACRDDLSGEGSIDTQKKAEEPYIYNDTDTIYFNSTLLNETIVFWDTNITDTNISNWTKADLNTLFNDTQWFNKTYTDSLYAGGTDTNCSDGSCLPILYWANDTYWNVTHNKTYDDYALNVSINYTKEVYDTWNEVWTSGADTNCSDGSCLPVLYWANESLLNVNSTTWWATVSGYVSKWFYNSGNNLAFNETELNNSIASYVITTYYNATQSQVLDGTINGGTLFETQHQDGNYDGKTFNFTEVAGSPGLDLRMNFTNIDDFNKGIIRYKTSTLAGGYPIIQLWNYDTSAWEEYPAIAESQVFATIEQSVFDSSHHVVEGVVQMRVYKLANGNINNHYYVDWIAITHGFGTPSGEEIDPYSYHTNENINATGYNITADYFIGNGSLLTDIAGTTDTNCSDESCLPVLYWNNQSYLNETDLVLSLNTTTNFQSLFNTIVTWVMNFSKIYSDDWSNVTITTSQITDYAATSDTNCSDGSCLPVLYWTNQSYLNETDLALSINTTENIILLEQDPEWDANFTNMQTECPAGNYTYSHYNNGTPKCRDDLVGETSIDTQKKAEEPYIYNDTDTIYFNSTLLNETIVFWDTNITDTDTNASTCGDGEYLDGDGTCKNIADLIVSYDTNITDTNISNWTKSDLNTLFNDTQWWNKTYADTLYGGFSDTNCSDGGCLPIFYWANQSYLNETDGVNSINSSVISVNNSAYSMNTTTNIQSLFYSAINWVMNFTKIYSEDWSNVTITTSQITDYSATTDTNCSDGGCLPVFYWTNQSYLNETDLAKSVNTTTNIQSLFYLAINWVMNFTKIYSEDWSNVTITESQITDLTHTTDTNASTCGDGEYLDGNGRCYNINDTIVALDTNDTFTPTNVAWVNETQTFILNQNFTENITQTTGNFHCMNSTCGQWFMCNNSGCFIQG